MGQIKPWQVVLIVAAVVAMGVSLYLTFMRGDDLPPQAERLTVVDVTTGELFSIPLSKKKAIVMPARNPQTGKMTLLPVSKSESGTWNVSRRDLGLLPLIEGKPEALDAKSGQVKVTSDTPKGIKL